MTTYRVGVVGAGGAADTHAAAVADVADATLVGVTSRTESTGRAFAERHDCAWYGTEDALLDDGVDVLAVCTPSGRHLEHVTPALERGVHVLCEKPLEVTTERVDRLIAAAGDSEASLGCVFQRRFSPAVRAVRDAVAAGRFGDLTAVTATVPWWRGDDYYDDDWHGTRRYEGGVLLNQALHHVDVLQWAVGAADGERAGNPVSEVVAYTGRRGHSPDLVDTEDVALGLLQFRNGVLGHVLGSTAIYPGSESRLTFAGTSGTAEVVADRVTSWTFEGDAAAPPDADGDRPGHWLHRRNVEAFLRSIADGTAFDLDPVEARKPVAIAEAMYRSAETGRPVTVDDGPAE